MHGQRAARFWIGLAWLAAWLGAAAPVGAENWPGWRGPRGDGTALEPALPTRWSPTENIAWKQRIPGVGHASPIVWGDAVFLVTCLEDTAERQLLALDRRTGQTRWARTVLSAPLEGKHTLNSFASSTPATDGRLVYVSFLDGEQMLIAAYDLDGEQRWLVRPGVFSSKHGYCSSPVLFENLVIVNGDHDGAAYLVALERDSGRVVWKVPRENKTRSYSTPIIRSFSGRPQLLLSGSLSVCSYDPRTGARNWIFAGPTEQFVASLVDDGELIYLTCGFPERHLMALRPSGQGQLDERHVVWHSRENAAYVPSPVVIGPYFLVVADDGIASCFEAKTGRRLWRERLGPRFSASLLAANGLCYFTSDRGVTKVVRPGPTFDLVAENELGEDCYASPAASQGQLFLRGYEHLFAIGAP